LAVSTGGLLFGHITKDKTHKLVLASVVFSIIVINAGVPNAKFLTLIVICTVFLSLIAHGISANPLANPATILTLGDPSQPVPMLAAIGFVVIAALSMRQVRGAILAGVLSITVLGLIMRELHYNGLVSSPPGIAPTLLQMDLDKALKAASSSSVLGDFMETPK
jgi:AGZA family xanthine/uracil permease-like MFS transporter